MISLIISFYKRLDFLNLILQGVERQSFKDFEVIVSEDDNAEETVTFLEEARKKYSFPIQHVSQEDKGFRKTKILNAAVLVAKGEQLVIIDGDCIPHKHFLKIYSKAITGKVMCYGRRGMLSKKYSDKLLAEKSIRSLGFFSALFNGCKSMGAMIYMPWKRNKDKQSRSILGCNWGVMKRNVLAINGFDEDYIRAGAGEDLDMDWRLAGIGLTKKSMKNKAIVYHLYHSSNQNHNNSDKIATHSLMAEKQKVGLTFCLNGIEKL